MDTETYEGWTNRETWAVALHVNNDQGWRESVLEALRDYVEAADFAGEKLLSRRAGEIIRENVEEKLDSLTTEADITAYGPHWVATVALAAHDIGSLWRVNWTELGASFLEDLEDQS